MMLVVRSLRPTIRSGHARLPRLGLAHHPLIPGGYPGSLIVQLWVDLGGCYPMYYNVVI